ncbi:MAG TPA: PQQ-binding-like beta-propeller repeat protein [Thermomicrobiales bacterium]|nr:PQQ-binding-like beta-propeller repeat protein [Thermomicrobiales bacterium]
MTLTQDPSGPGDWHAFAPMNRRAALAALGAGMLGAIDFVGKMAAPTPARAQGQTMATPNALGPAIPPVIVRFAADWPTAQGNLAAHRAATASAIRAENVDRLAVAWRLPLAAESAYGAVTATPIVAGETIYLQDMASNVFALDRTSGSIRWRRDYQSPTAGGNGVAIGYGLAFAVIGLSAEVVALRVDTGDEVWRVKLSANPNEFVMMQPLVSDNVVYVSTAPAAYVGGTRGILFALDAKTGGVLWQWDTTTDNLWGNARANAGGGLWQPPSVDERGNLYFGVGNPAPWPEIGVPPEQSTRPGPNLYSSAMVSLDPAAGSVRWFVQPRPHDDLDHDFQNTPVLATVDVDGSPRLLAIGSGKTGTVIAADAATGAVVWQASVGKHNALGDGAPLPTPSATPIAVVPGLFGGVLTPIAYGRDTVFAPVIDLPFTYSSTAVDFDLATATGAMVALNAADGASRWSAPVDTFFAAGATLVNDVVFGAGLDGVVRGFAADGGQEIWRFQANAGVNAPLAIAGDMLFVPAGGPFLPHVAAPPKPRPELIALRLGAAGATAVASPAL